MARGGLTRRIGLAPAATPPPRAEPQVVILRVSFDVRSTRWHVPRIGRALARGQC